MSKPMDPFSGSYSMSPQMRIPAWEKGAKLPHWDSSDLSGVSSSSSEEDSSFGDASYVCDSDSELNERVLAGGFDITESEMTPRAAKKKLHHRGSTGSAGTAKSGSSDKGKGKAKNQDAPGEEDDEASPSASLPTSSGRPHHHHGSARSRTRRPRSHSNTSSSVSSPPFLSSLSPPSTSASLDAPYRILSKRTPGPAAQAMADFMAVPTEEGKKTGQPSQSSFKAPRQSASTSSSPFQGLMPASALAPSSSKLGSRPLSRPVHLIQNSNRQLGRATSAPNNLFAESLPTNNLFSPGRGGLPRTEEEGGSCPASPSPEADLQTVLDKAYESRSGSIDLSRKNLVRIPANISDLSHFVSLDIRTDKSYPTPIDLYLDSNYLNAAGLPSSLFTIANLRILSLRGNQIESLPQSVGNLTSLKELLLFNNKLTYLPAEILELKLEKLHLGSNRFPSYMAVTEQENNTGKTESKEAKETEEAKATKAVEKLDTSLERVCEPRKRNFIVPSLVETCTRRLLQPVDAGRDNGSPAITKSKLFTPGMGSTSTSYVRRNFHTVKDRVTSSPIDYAPVPPHLLKPFLPLLNPLPHHLRCLLSPAHSPDIVNNRILGTPSSAHTSRTPGTPNPFPNQTPFEAVKDIPQCSVCKAPCSQFAETRIEWRSEIAGVKLGKGDDERCWVPVLWRGCSAHCLDFLDEA